VVAAAWTTSSFGSVDDERQDDGNPIVNQEKKLRKITAADGKPPHVRMVPPS
jgi:hypothetical protein